MVLPSGCFLFAGKFQLQGPISILTMTWDYTNFIKFLEPFLLDRKPVFVVIYIVQFPFDFILFFKQI